MFGANISNFFTQRALSWLSRFAVNKPILWSATGLIAAVTIAGGYLIFYNKTTTLHAIAVWESGEGETREIAYSVYFAYPNEWYALLPEKKEVPRFNVIAETPGVDRNPDVASTETMAIAVWEYQENNNSKIATAIWDAKRFAEGETGWSPVTYPFEGGPQADPTIQIRSPQDAMAVWVENNWKLKYARFDGESWSKPKEISIPVYRYRISAPELAELPYKGAPYTLAFAVDGNLYTAVYDEQADRWSLEPQRNTVVKNTRISFSSDARDKEAVLAWMLRGNTAAERILTITDTAQHEKTPATETAVTKPLQEQAYWLTAGEDGVFEVNQKTTLTQEKAVNIAATYLIDNKADRAAVALWKDASARLVFAPYNRNGKNWESPAFLVEDAASPVGTMAVAPLLVRVTKKDIEPIAATIPLPPVGDDCGDGVLDPQWGEECEDGIACQNPGEICDWEIWNQATKAQRKKMFPPECLCYPIDDTPEPPQDPQDPKGTDANPRTPDEKGTGKNPKDTSVKPKEKDGSWLPWGKGKKEKQKDVVIYHGSACGFASLHIVEKRGEDQIVIRLLPPSRTGDTYTISKTKEGEWNVMGDIALFPLAAEEKYQQDGVVMLYFNPGDAQIKMSGFQKGVGLRLCTGSFDKTDLQEDPLEQGGLVPGFVPATAQ